MQVQDTEQDLVWLRLVIAMGFSLFVGDASERTVLHHAVEVRLTVFRYNLIGP